MPSAWWRRNSNQLALVLLVSGLFVAVSAVEFPATRVLLLSTYWTFFSAAVLLYFLTPERRVRAAIGERIYEGVVANEAELVEAYDLQDVQVYLPSNGAGSVTTDDSLAWLFVPRHAEFALPNGDELESPFVASDVEWRRGLLFRPTGDGLFREFVSMLNGKVSDSPDELAIQLADGLSEGLELADRATPTAQPERQRVDFEIDDGLYEPIDRFDHPIQSFLAVGFAIGLNRPILVETATASEGHSGGVVTCHWGIDDRADATRQIRGSRSAPAWPNDWVSKNDRTARESNR
jgi:hypothetical protein